MSKANDIATYGQYQPQRRNIIINGGFNIWQRGTSIVPANGDFQADRFKWEDNGAGTVTYLQSIVVPAETNGVSLRIAVGTADASIATADYYQLVSNLEGYDTAHLVWGKSAAKTVTLSFWIYATKTGTQAVSFRNNGVGRSYIATFTVNASDTWEYKTITVPGDTSGTWDTGITSGIRIGFAVGIGSTFHAPADNAWQAGNYIGSSSAVNNMDNAVNEYRLKNVQLEVGTEATDFEYRHFGDELALCQRYYCKTSDYDVYQGDTDSKGVLRIDAGGTTNRPYVSFRYPVTMRGIPDITPWNAVTGTLDECYNASAAANYACTVDVVGHNGCTMRVQGATPTIGDAIDFHASADAEL
jgi:hypothetical protein